MNTPRISFEPLLGRELGRETRLAEKSSAKRLRAQHGQIREVEVSGERSTPPRQFWKNSFTHFTSGVPAPVLGGVGPRDPVHPKEHDVGSNKARSSRTQQLAPAPARPKILTRSTRDEPSPSRRSPLPGRTKGRGGTRQTGAPKSDRADGLSSKTAPQNLFKLGHRRQVEWSHGYVLKVFVKASGSFLCTGLYVAGASGGKVQDVLCDVKVEPNPVTSYPKGNPHEAPGRPASLSALGIQRHSPEHSL